MKKLVERIRKIDPTRMIIIEAQQTTSSYPVDALNKLDVLPDPNIAYDVHFYHPYIVTHQGINQGFEDKQTGYFLNVPYPSALVDKS